MLKPSECGGQMKALNDSPVLLEGFLWSNKREVWRPSSRRRAINGRFSGATWTRAMSGAANWAGYDDIWRIWVVETFGLRGSTEDPVEDGAGDSFM